MTHLIEGHWNNFVIKMAEPGHYPEIVNLMRNNFYRDEPLTLCFGGLDEESATAQDNEILDLLHYKISFVAIDKLSGEIAGAQLAKIQERSKNGEILKSQTTKAKHQSRTLTLICELLGKVGAGDGDVFKRFPDVEKCVTFGRTAVDSKFRGQGLATELYRRRLTFAKAEGVPVVKGVFTSPFTRKAAAKLGFIELNRIHFHDYKDPITGLSLLPNAKPDDFIAVLALRLF